MKKVLLSVLAHPDDESFGMGGTLAKYASEGVDVHLICATRGEAGEVDAELGGPEDGLGDIIAGVVGIGSLLGGLFGKKHHETDPQIPPPPPIINPAVALGV